MRILAFVLGLLLLLPGACTLIYMSVYGFDGVMVTLRAAVSGPSNGGTFDQLMIAIWATGLLLGLLGVSLIWWARRRKRKRETDGFR